MSVFSRLFSKKSSDDFLKKGDALFHAQRYFEAREQYEDGLRVHVEKNRGNESDATATLLRSKVADANRELARINIGEAEYAISRGNMPKAVEHLELAISLTDDGPIHLQCRELLARCAGQTAEPLPTHPSLHSSGCGTCVSGDDAAHPHAGGNAADLSLQDHYDLLIRQLPAEMYSRYATLDESFKVMYLAACNDEHENALNLLEEWYKSDSEDIYWYEKGMLLHRLGRDRDAETCLGKAFRCDSANPLPRLGLALLFRHELRFPEAAELLDALISDGMIIEQARLLRGDVAEHSGDIEGAIERYGMLLSTSLARPAAERLYDILIHSGRTREAANVQKKFLGGCRR